MIWFFIASAWICAACVVFQGILMRKSRRGWSASWVLHAEQLRDVQRIADGFAVNVRRDSGVIPEMGIQTAEMIAALIGWQAYFAEVHAGLHDNDVTNYFDPTDIPNKEQP